MLKYTPIILIILQSIFAQSMVTTSIDATTPDMALYKSLVTENYKRVYLYEHSVKVLSVLLEKNLSEINAYQSKKEALGLGLKEIQYLSQIRNKRTLLEETLTRSKLTLEAARKTYAQLLSELPSDFIVLPSVESIKLHGSLGVEQQKITTNLESLYLNNGLK